MSGTPDMAAQVEALRAQIAELAGSVSELRTKLDEDGDQGGSAQEQDPGTDFGKVDLSPLKPFEIQYFFGSKQWKIYLPEGCVKVGDEPAEYDGNIDGNQMADVPTGATTLYAHVTASADSPSGNYSFTIDDNPGGSDSLYNFKVASFDSDAQKEVMVQFVSGLVLLERAKKKKAYVVTGVSQTMDGEDGLVLSVTKAPILVDEPSGSETSATLAEETTSTTVATLTEVTYVTGSVYDPGDHSFRNQTRTVKALVDEDSASSGSASVFTAEPVCGGH